MHSKDLGLLVREASEDTNKGDLVGKAQSIGDAPAGDLVPVALEKAAIVDQPAGDVEVAGHGGLPGTNGPFS